MKSFRSKAAVAVTFLMVLSIIAAACGDDATPTSVPATPTSVIEPTSTTVIVEETGGRITVALAERNDSGQSGSATLTGTGDQTEVVIDAIPGISGIQHLHNGSCDELGAMVHDLGTLGADGTSTTLVEASLESLLAGDFVINLHDKSNAGIYTSCGAISASGDTSQSNGSSPGPY